MCQYLVSKGEATSATDSLGYVGLRNVLNGQVQDVLYAVSTLTVLDCHDITSGLLVGLTIPFPDIRVAVADGLVVFRTAQFASSINSDDTVAPEVRFVRDRIYLAVICELMSTVGEREVMRGDTLRPCVDRIHRQIQYIE